MNEQMDFMSDDTGLLKDQILTSLEAMQSEMEVVKSEVKLNITDHIGQMVMNVTKLKMEQDSLKNEMFDLNSMVTSSMTSNLPYFLP